ncbi:hypothetical protein, partial [Escherichia coli]
MLALTGRLADGWLPSLGRTTVEDLARAGALVDDAAREAGRSPADVRRLLNVGGRFGVQSEGQGEKQGDGPLHGPP